MEQAVQSNAFETDIQDILKSVPACRRCRKKHRRCDSSVPRCRNCVKAGIEECWFDDQILGQQVSRSHVVSLATRLQQLRTAEDAPTGPGPSDGGGDKGACLFFGQDSCISASVFARNPHEQVNPRPTPPGFLAEPYQTSGPSVAAHNFMILNYMSTVHRQYPILEESETVLQSHTPDAQIPLPSNEQFLLNMVYSTSCLCAPASYKLLPLANAFRSKAMDYVEGVKSQVSNQSCRSIALMAINCLFSPDQGNLNQLIGLASRLCVDLGIYKSDDESLRKLYLSILCLERQVALVLDRPWFLPEPTKQHGAETCEPVELLWSLLSLQCSSRRAASDGQSDHPSTTTTLDSLRESIEMLKPPMPCLVSALHEAALLIAEQHHWDDPPECRAKASSLLNAYDSPLCFHTSLTPHWTFKAAHVLLKHSSSSTATRASRDFLRALLMLDRDTARWPFCSYLLNTLQSLPAGQI